MWSFWPQRPTLSPYASMNQGRTPDVTEQDYSYITTQELEEDDIIDIKCRGITYEAHFPAYSIGDGKLKVHDIRERVGALLDLPDYETRRVQLFYKGRQLKEPGALVRDYGVKNKSEILAKIRDDNPRDRYEGGYGSEDDDIVVAEEGGGGGSSYGGSSVGIGKSSSKRRKGRKPKKKAKPAGPSSPRDDEAAQDDPNRHPSPSLSYRETQLAKLDEVAAYFDEELAPLCIKFTRSPPRDPVKLEDEHRRLSETILQRVIFRLDAVEPDGDEKIRARRKELVKESQQVLAQLDAAKASVK